MLDRGWMAALLVLAAALPLLWPPIPPLVDVLGHMGRYKVELDGARGFAFEWRLIGNLGVDLLIVPFGSLFGVELGAKLIVLAIPVIAATGIIWLSREAHGRVSPAAPFAIALIYSYPFHFGFINFALSSALAFHAFALWLRLGRQGRERLRAMLFVAISALLWVVHTVGWGLLGLCVFGAELVRNRESGRGLIRSAFRAGIACLPLTPPVLLMLLTRSSSHRAVSGDFFNWEAKFVWAASIFRERWLGLDLACAILIYLVILWAAIDRRARFAPVLAVPALLCLAAFILMPRIAVGSAYADMRLAPFTLALALLAIAPKEGKTLAVIAATGMAFLAARVAATTVSFVMYNQGYARELPAVEALPRGASVLALVSRPCFTNWNSPREDHLPSFAIIRRGAFTNDQWSIDNAQLIRIAQPFVGRYGEDPSQLVYPRSCRPRATSQLDEAAADFDRRAFDHVWTIGAPPGAFPASDVRLIWSNGRSALYRVVRNGRGG
jgi:hypothetical protein